MGARRRDLRARDATAAVGSSMRRHCGWKRKALALHLLALFLAIDRHVEGEEKKQHNDTTARQDVHIFPAYLTGSA